MATKMDRKDAIRYLENKDELDNPYFPREERKFTQEEEAEIKKVMKRGRIYGDPMVVLNE